MLHDNRPPPGTIIRKSSFNHYATDQVVGSAPSALPTLLADLAAQYAASHPPSAASGTAGPITAHPLSVAPNSPAPLVPTVPNTPEATPSRSSTFDFSRSPSLDLPEIDWEEVYVLAQANEDRLSGADGSCDCGPLRDPLEFLGSPPPSPTERDIDSNWPSRSRADESATLEDVDYDVDSDINPDDFDDFDYNRPPLWTPPSYRPSENIEPTHWYNTADALEAEAMVAIELYEARKRVTETAAALVIAQAAADMATLAAYNAAKDPSQDPVVVQTLNLDMVKAAAESASKAVEAAAAVTAEARAQEAALAAGGDVDYELETDEDGFFISTLPWALSGYWSISDQKRVLGETLGEYREH
ncbi:hypothetical protein HYPSUDRAFT_54237 [Hypholoma sublateritium FD-334 SS-4]|uniref:Uncharacterized protein n=1 Tax=Hypholoma sublateritium (strain FD-334 SS-4) TaxID=945553 RepID=A0A0D2NXH2_HYPSF|nr:hypothetical protein HYPSUDRAFT_54237 [Hypholoma sublateritium FD-334 SS-4]